MEYDVNDFNGEITPKLLNYKIPLKVSSTSNPQTDSNVENSNEKEVFSSPLLQIDAESLNGRNIFVATQNQQQPDADPFLQNDRKRKHSVENVLESKTAVNVLESKTPVNVLESRTPVIVGRDPTYPDSLNELIMPLACNLCKSNFNSMKIAIVHYESKTHEKKIVNWLTNWTKETGQPLPKIPKLCKEGLAGPDAYHCDVCDLPLTSLQHAKQHYNGKKHKMVVSNISKPSGSGYYDSSGKWINTPTNIVATDSRFGIGGSFVQTPVPNLASTDESQPATVDSSLHCDVCDINVTSKQQMDMHLNGIKHAKKLKALGKPPYSAPDDTLLASIQSPTRNDPSMYRTPSGNYYCKTCNITLSEPIELKQHLGSKRHAKNLKKTTVEENPTTAK